MINTELYALAEKTVNNLKSKNLTVSTAESCTGGLVSAYITSVPGVSSVFSLGITSYSCEIKNSVLNVNQKILDRFGAISLETATEMAQNVRKIAKSDLGISVTGVAGPDSSEGHPMGYVFIAVSGDNGTDSKLLNIEPISRDFVRENAVAEIFRMINNYIKD